jgi:hypothetical protein
MAEHEFLVHAIVEIAGAPKDFVDKTMAMLLEHMGKDESFKITGKKRFEMKEHDGLFSTFTELDVSFACFDDLVSFCFSYMPSHIELEHPSRLELRREELAETLNTLLMDLHKRDDILKEVKARYKLVEDANKLLLKNMLAIILENGALALSEISKRAGIKEPNLQSILDFYEENKLIKKKGKKYGLVK